MSANRVLWCGCGCSRMEDRAGPWSGCGGLGGGCGRVVSCRSVQAGQWWLVVGGRVECEARVCGVWWAKFSFERKQLSEPEEPRLRKDDCRTGVCEHGAAAVNSRITGGWRRTRDVNFSRSAATLACTNTPSESGTRRHAEPQATFRLLLCASLIFPLLLTLENSSNSIPTRMFELHFVITK